MFMMKLRYVSSQVLYMLHEWVYKSSLSLLVHMVIWSYGHRRHVWCLMVKKCGCTIGQQRTWLVHSLVMLLSSPNITRPQSPCITVHWWLLARLVRCSYTWFLPLLLLRGMILWSYHCHWICKWWAQLMKPKVQFIFIETFAKDKRVP